MYTYCHHVMAFCWTPLLNDDDAFICLICHYSNRHINVTTLKFCAICPRCRTQATQGFLEYTERIGMNDIESDVNTGIRSTVKMYD